MKIDRLLGITIYLLNHKRVSAQTLSNRFEVSTRTIIRDMETLCMAGIPVVSTYGVDGGYEILDTFKLERQLAGIDEYTYIITALQGFVTAYNSKEIEDTLEKVRLQSKHNESNVILDFDVLHENGSINHKLALLEKSIKEGHIVFFQYTNAENVMKTFEVEPVATMYKWYQWYLLCYYPKYQDYRSFKLIRMEDIIITEHSNSRKHSVEEAKKIWENQPDTREYIHIKLYCSKEVKISCLEYLKGSVESEFENGDIILSLCFPKQERFWFGTILSFGNKVKVLEPQELRHKIVESCKEIMCLYGDV